MSLDAQTSQGSATFTMTPGSHSLIAAYGGDANYLPATSPTLNILVF